MSINSLDIIETLKFCLLGSFVGISCAILFLIFFYKFSQFFVAFNSLKERVDFLEEVLSDDIKKIISKNLSK